MGSESAHQLFPMGSLYKHLPARKGSARYTTRPPAGLPEFEILKPSGTTSGIVIAITEPPPPLKTLSAPPIATAATDRTSQRRPQPPPLTIPPKAHITQEQMSESFPSPLSPSATEVPLPRSSAETTASVQSISDASTAVQTPAMRSMFPSYNPNLPVTQQHYYPRMEYAAVPAYTRTVAGQPSRSNDPYLQRRSQSWDTSIVISEAANNKVPTIKNDPLRRSESLKRPAKLSTPEELLDLWDIANGQMGENSADAYTLELSCEDLAAGHEIITFNNSSSQAFYTLSASKDAIAVSRTHPTSQNPTIQISSSSLSNPTSTSPLITSIFPKLAGLMALDQSSTVAVSHKLSRSESVSLQAEAVSRAQEREASMLLWDDASDKYCLMHPTLLDSAATTLPITITPNPSNPEIITISAPETTSPLLTLSLTNLTLTLHTSAITALPSLYIQDTLLATLLTLLLHLHRSCANPAGPKRASTLPIIPTFPPPPRSLHSRSSKTNLKRQGTSSRLSLFRSKTAKSNTSLASPHDPDRDIELASLPPHTPGIQSVAFGEEAKARQRPPKTIFTSDDESLSKGTRAVLRLLYWGFEALYWVLGVLALVLSAAVVRLGKVVTKL